jgi:hypothetical protein
MDESFLLKLALATSAIGICALLVMLRFENIEASSIGSAKLESEDTTVKISGVVSRVSPSGNLTVITLRREESVEVVAFGSFNLSKGAEVSVEGRVRDYKGRKEILAEKIILK